MFFAHVCIDQYKPKMAWSVFCHFFGFSTVWPIQSTDCIFHENALYILTHFSEHVKFLRIFCILHVLYMVVKWSVTRNANSKWCASKCCRWKKHVLYWTIQTTDCQNYVFVKHFENTVWIIQYTEYIDVLCIIAFWNALYLWYRRLNDSKNALYFEKCTLFTIHFSFSVKHCTL